MIAILGAMEAEIRVIRGAVENASVETWADRGVVSGTLGGRRVVVTHTGVGKSMAAMTCQRVVDRYAPAAVLFVGIAGALSKELALGDIVLGESTIQYDMDATVLGFARGEIPYTPYRSIPSDPAILAVAQGYPHDKAVVTGRILTADHFVGDRSENQGIWDELKGTVVEMEGASISLVCEVNGLPHLVIRLVSDGADGNAPSDFASFLKLAGAELDDIARYVLERLPYP